MIQIYNLITELKSKNKSHAKIVAAFFFIIIIGYIYIIDFLN